MVSLGGLTDTEGADPKALRISAVRSRSARKEFLECEYTLCGGDPRWVPPLRSHRRRLLSRRRNPFLSHGRIELYLGRRGDEVVGRIAAVLNPLHNQHHGTRDGFFGLFVCNGDEEVAHALFDAAAQWLEEHGMTSMVGPVNFSTNYECGVLVDGFDLPPAVLMPWNPPLWPKLLENSGFLPVQELHAWEWTCRPEPPAALTRISAAATARGITVRAVEKSHQNAELARVRDLYNRAWQHNWGFVPPTRKEFQALVRQMRPLLRPELALVAEVAGEPVGFCLTLPDVTTALRATGGRLHHWGVPLGLLRMLLALRKVRRGRLLVLGITEEHRHSAALGILLAKTEQAVRRLKYEAVEISWVLDSNAAALRVLRAIGCHRTKTYRIYRRELRTESAG